MAQTIFRVLALVTLWLSFRGPVEVLLWDERRISLLAVAYEAKSVLAVPYISIIGGTDLVPRSGIPFFFCSLI